MCADEQVTREYSILDMFNGELRDQVDAAIKKVIDNITDYTTVEAAQRGIVISIDFCPYADRSRINTKATVKIKLAPRDSARTTLLLSPGQGGEVKAVEWDGQMEGQQRL